MSVSDLCTCWSEQQVFISSNFYSIFILKGKVDGRITCLEKTFYSFFRWDLTRDVNSQLIWKVIKLISAMSCESPGLYMEAAGRKCQEHTLDN